MLLQQAADAQLAHLLYASDNELPTIDTTAHKTITAFCTPKSDAPLDRAWHQSEKLACMTPVPVTRPGSLFVGAVGWAHMACH